MGYIIVLGGGIESIDALKKIKRNNKIILIDKNKKAPGLKYADKKIIQSIKDFNKLKKLISSIKKKYKIIAILSFSDVPYIVSKLAKYLKLKSTNIKSSKISSNKILLKQKLKKKIPIPNFCKVKNFNDLKKFFKKNKKIILKPVDNSGSRGVIFIENRNKLLDSFNYCLKYSKKNYLIAEKFVSGPQISTEGCMINGKYYHIAASDRCYDLNKIFKPFIVENGGETPSKFEEKNQKKMENIIEKSANIIGLKNGFIKGDLVFHKKKMHVIEVATRLSSGFYSSITIPFCKGVDMIDEFLHFSKVGEIRVKNILPKKNLPVSQRYFFKLPNEQKIKYLKKKYKDNIVSFTMFKNKPSKIENHSSRLGQVIVTGKNIKQAIRIANLLTK